MLLDNKTLNEDKLATVFQFLEQYTEGGDLDLVSGYFSISGLALLYEKLNQVGKFRMILGEITEDKKLKGRVIDLLTEDISVVNALQLKQEAQRAVDFILQEKVTIKTVEPNFCHAKTYIYKDKDIRKSYYALGSSNLTLAGLGLKESSNVELNTAKFSDDKDFKEVQAWYKKLWENHAREYTIIDNKRVNFKEHLVTLIKNFFYEYSPLQLYYKTLYELFKDQLPELYADATFEAQLGHLKNTRIFNILYPFQQKGVMSLIRMIQGFNGAILADAVGLGKTWQALAVMKYFQLQGYEVVLLCPKKLENNWRRYLVGHKSKFESDRLRFVIRYHTDLQDNRLETKEDGFRINTYFQNNPKILFVIDESHNLRNDKSNRYKFLVETLLSKNADVKMLLLSATPINNHITDVRNQFKLITKGQDDGFRNMPELAINSLSSLFRSAQKEFNIWQKSVEPNKKIEELVSKLPQKMFDLTDKLIVARTRKIIESQATDLVFPKKLPPQNIYSDMANFGKLKSFASVLDALRINMTAYRPTEFTDAAQVESVLEDNIQREKFLAKMMYILLVKRLESSWNAFEITVDNIYKHHKNALDKAKAYALAKKDSELEEDTSEDVEELEEVAQLVENQILGDNNPNNDDSNPLEATLGKKRPIKLSDIANAGKLDSFIGFLETDVRQLEFLKTNISEFEKKFALEKTADKSIDKKLEKLMQLVSEKQEQPNKKIVIFTCFKDTAQYLYDQLILRGYSRIGLITGSFCKTTEKIAFKKSDFEPLLEAFAPYTKLYLERDWSMYSQNDNDTEGSKPFNNFEEFKTFIRSKDAAVKNALDNPIDIMIATDCISEGQNLQDCDCVVNYDIHWNPVRLIQRFGRIDRIGSPNETVKGVNFWPGKNFDSYLNLKGRVENRMAAFSLVGSEFDANTTPELADIVRDNPLISRQTENILRQLQTTWDDIEDNSQSFGFDKLSLEEFRQELYEHFLNKKDELEAIPSGVYTGFRRRLDLFQQELSTGIIALLRYKGETPNGKAEHHLLYADENGSNYIINSHEILHVLRRHKEEKRYVPSDVDSSNPEALQHFADIIQTWMDKKAGRKAVEDIQMLLEFGIEDAEEANEESDKDELLEMKFRNENFELITWFVLS